MPRSLALCNHKIIFSLDRRNIGCPLKTGQLARAVLEHDLKYSREVTLERAAEFGDPKDVIYRLRSKIGYLFKEEF